MTRPILTLASASSIRAQLLQNAGVAFDVIPSDVDEVALRQDLARAGSSPRETADALALAKARSVSGRTPGLVLGSDQIAVLGDRILSKPGSREEAVAQLAALSGRTHRLITAAALVDNGIVSWRETVEVSMKMRPLGEAFILDYVRRNWDSIRHTVGCYKIEEEGIRLFERIEGDHFAILGLPILELLSYLIGEGLIET